MKVALQLFHGRSDPEQQMDGWGAEGPVFLLDSLLEHAWARTYAERPGTYLVGDGAEVVPHLERLYADKPLLTA